MPTIEQKKEVDRMLESTMSPKGQFEEVDRLAPDFKAHLAGLLISLQPKQRDGALESVNAELAKRGVETSENWRQRISNAVALAAG